MGVRIYEILILTISRRHSLHDAAGRRAHIRPLNPD